LNLIQIITMSVQLRKGKLEETNSKSMRRRSLMTFETDAGLIFLKVILQQQEHQIQMAGASLPSWGHMNVF
jgi:hypothetical protein